MKTETRFKIHPLEVGNLTVFARAGVLFSVFVFVGFDLLYVVWLCCSKVLPVCMRVFLWCCDLFSGLKIRLVYCFFVVV